MTQAKVERTESGTEDITARTRRKAQTAFNWYVKILARENGDYTSDEDLSDVFEDLLDYATLEERSQKAIDAANLFANPEYFQEQFQRILTIQQKLYDNKKEEIEASLKIGWIIQLLIGMEGQVFLYFLFLLVYLIST